MSAFLSDIHYWLYTKIQYLQKINDELITIYEINNSACLSHINYTLPLEQVIDLEQIHGSLNYLVQDVEHRNALIINNLLTHQSLEEIKDIYYQLGKKESIINENALDAFQNINTYLLDGMPCDQGLDILMQDSDQVIFEYNPNVHSSDLSFEILQSLREAWINGYLSQSHISFISLSQTQYILKMED